MAARIPAVHRWCASGTPLSAERGLADAFDLLHFLRAAGPAEATDRRAFAAAIAQPAGAGRARLLSALRSLMRRTTKPDAAAQNAFAAPPLQHVLLLPPSAAEVAWAQRDAEAGGLPASLLPPYPEGLTPADEAEGSASAETGAAAGDTAEGAAHAEPLSNLSEGWQRLQPALTHPQLSRTWVGRGNAEAQVDTGAPQPRKSGQCGQAV